MRYLFGTALGRTTFSSQIASLLHLSFRGCSSFAAVPNPSQKSSVETLRSRLLYQSRKRGILETCIILGQFAEQNLSGMDEKELNEYSRIINGEHMDWDLYYFFTGSKKVPLELANSSVFHKIQAHVIKGLKK